MKSKKEWPDESIDAFLNVKVDKTSKSFDQKAKAFLEELDRQENRKIIRVDFRKYMMPIAAAVAVCVGVFLIPWDLDKVPVVAMGDNDHTYDEVLNMQADLESASILLSDENLDALLAFSMKEDSL